MVSVSEVAQQKLLDMMFESGYDKSCYVRVGVESGGCSGLSYKLDFDVEKKETDKCFEDKGIKLQLKENIIGFIKKSNLSREKSEQKIDRFAVNESVDSMIISVDQKLRILNLSIKDLEIYDEKEALNKYGSSDSGASLGDILGSALDKKKEN